MFVFKHPKYYTELRKRNKSDQVISSGSEGSALPQRAPDQGHKPQASSVKHQAPEASSHKLQAPSNKRQASSRKRQAP
jgi:phage protein D